MQQTKAIISFININLVTYQMITSLNFQIKMSLTVCVTGAAGQIAYSFIPQLLRGNAFPNVSIRLKLLDIPTSLKAMEGVIMEINDSTYPLLLSVECGIDANLMFKDADVIVFFGGFPRKQGMERKDLLQMNKKIFVEQSKALSAAKPNVKCVVIANPANTNAYILSHFNPNIKRQNITCLTRLDHNRAISQISLKTKAPIEKIKGIMIFGNHSLTQYPCTKHIQIKNEPIQKLVGKEWLEKQFISKVQNRGGEILKSRGGSSVCSAASATIDHLRDWYLGTDEIVSMGVVSNGDYGIPAGIWSSFPVKCANFSYRIATQYELSQFCKGKIATTTKQMMDQIDGAQVPRPKL